jgi:hypothetical protein
LDQVRERLEFAFAQAATQVKLRRSAAALWLNSAEESWWFSSSCGSKKWMDGANTAPDKEKFASVEISLAGKMEQVRKGGLPRFDQYSGGKPLFLTCSAYPAERLG